MCDSSKEIQQYQAPHLSAFVLQLEAITLSPCSRYPSLGICGALEFDSTNEAPKEW